ncbi:MAG: NUDIX hydrolase [Armatimonadota bacterium]
MHFSFRILLPTLCRRLRRYFYHLTATDDTGTEWTVQNDYHLFRPFWAPLDNLPVIVEPQDGWVRYVREGLGYRLENGGER